MKTLKNFLTKKIILISIIISLFSVWITSAFLYYKEIDCNYKWDSLNTKICDYLKENNMQIPSAYLENPDEKNNVQFNYILNPNQIPKIKKDNIDFKELTPTVIYK